MRAVCVICTELFVINSHISACSCGHIFHEECIFRWIKTSKQTSCPQCRAKLKESEIIKRLYLTESTDSTLSTQSIITIDELNSENQLSESVKQKYEDFLNKIEILKGDLKDKSESLSSKSKLIEQKDLKIKDLEEFKSSHQKRLGENQILIDYLKKELENYGKLKDQYDTREKTIFELEAKVREYRSIEMIFKDHEGQFASEMHKYIIPNPSISHAQSIIRHLVSTNVILKKELDKNTEEKKTLRKRLITVERNQADKDKFMNKKEQEMSDLLKRVKILENELKLVREKAPRDEAQAISASSPSLSTTPRPSRMSLTNDDSDIQYLDEVGRFENSYLRKRVIVEDSDSESVKEFDNKGLSDIESPEVVMLRKRKNPFLKLDDEDKESGRGEDDDDDVLITSYQAKKPVIETVKDDKEENKKKITYNNVYNLNKMLSRDDNVIDLVKPVEKVVKPEAKRFIKTNSFSSPSESKLFNKNSNKLNDSVEIKPLINRGSSYHFDGLGGRSKIINNSSSSSSSSSSSTSSGINKLFKFSRSKVT